MGRADNGPAAPCQRNSGQQGRWSMVVTWHQVEEARKHRQLEARRHRWSRHEGVILEAPPDCALRCVAHAAIVRPLLGDRGEMLFCSSQSLWNKVTDTLYTIVSHIYHLHVPNFTFTANLISATNRIYHLHVPCIVYYITFTSNQYQLFIAFTAYMLCCIYMYMYLRLVVVRLIGCPHDGR